MLSNTKQLVLNEGNASIILNNFCYHLNHMHKFLVRLPTSIAKLPPPSAASPAPCLVKNIEQSNGITALRHSLTSKSPKVLRGKMTLDAARRALQHNF